MIPALASIIAAYVIFRCVSVTLNALVQLRPNSTTRAWAFVLIPLGALYEAFIAIVKEAAITGAAGETSVF